MKFEPEETSDAKRTEELVKFANVKDEHDEFVKLYPSTGLLARVRTDITSKNFILPVLGSSVAEKIGHKSQLTGRPKKGLQKSPSCPALYICRYKTPFHVF